MALKRSYKQTSVGRIPEDWDVSALVSLTTKIGSGITPRGGDKVYKTEGRPFLRSQNVGWGELLLDDIAFIDDETHFSFSSTELKEYDVLLNITGASIGRSAVADARLVGGNVNQHVCIIRADIARLYPLFLNLFLLSQLGQKQIDSFQAGGNRQGLNFGQIKSFLLPLPPLSEQHAIAAALSDVDALLASLDALIEKKRAIKQGVMQELLTGRRRLPGFSGEWEVVRLDDCLELLTDFEANGSFADVADNVRVFDSENFAWYVRATDLEEDTPTENVKHVDEDTYKYLKKTSLFGGEVLITKRGDIGKVYYFSRKTQFATLGPNLYLLKLNSRAVPYFVYLYFKFGPGNRGLTKNNASTTLGALYKNDVKAIEITLPVIEEQKAISAIISAFEAEVQALEQQRDKTRLLKQGMMQELLTGRTRLV